VSGWAKRVFAKFQALTDDPSLQQAPEDIVVIFKAMESITTAELQMIKDRAEENPIEPDDAFIDFATEDFINKNIRVRPISGVTHGDDTRDGRASNISKGGGNDETDEAQGENYNRIAIYEIENQRKAVKKKAADYQEELRRKQALEEKKKEKR